MTTAAGRDCAAKAAALTTALPKLLRHALPSTRRHRGIGAHAALYLVAGTLTTLLQVLLYLAVRAPLGPQPANLVAIAVTTIANTEFHRLVTFAGEQDAPARRHLQTCVSFVFYAFAGSMALFVLHALEPEPSVTVESVVLVATSFAGGVARFLVLRYWVFGHRTKVAE